MSEVQVQAPAPVKVGLWGPPPPKVYRGAGLRHIGLAVLTVLGMSLVPLFVAVFVIARRDPDVLMTPEAPQVLMDWMVGTGPGLLFTLVCTWIGLMIPVFVAARSHPGGWRDLVSWKFSWKTDLLIAVGFTVGFRAVETGVSWVLSEVAGVDTSQLSNGGMLTAAGAGWVLILGLGAAIGAPLSEELLFRGLILRVLGSRFGRVVGVVGSSLLFGLMHTQDNLAATIYTVTSTGILGLAMALLIVKTGRLGTPLLAHAFFNGSAVVLVLLGLAG